MAKPVIALIGADTARARAYADTLRRLSAHFDLHGIFYGGPAPGSAPDPLTGQTLDGLRIPDISASLQRIFSQEAWPQTWLDSPSVNSPEMHSALAALRPALAIFAGRGGEIVSPTLIRLAPLLHIHPGSLPGHRGSTTIYYSILEGLPVTASALLLSADIDAGPVLMKKDYPPPRPNLDPDILYDCAIRADLLASVLQHLRDHGSLPAALDLDGQENGLYFVIHPLLKHLAIGKIKKG